MYGGFKIVSGPYYKLQLQSLQELLGNQIVALNQEIEWPPWSPDLTKRDFLLWGELQARVEYSQSAKCYFAAKDDRII